MKNTTKVSTASIPNVVANNGFEFRTKFQRLIEGKNRELIEVAFHKFCRFSYLGAINTLWSLTYPGNNDVIFTLVHLGLDFKLIPANKVTVLRNELLYQYSKCNKNFMVLEMTDECNEPFTELKKCTDSITAYVVYSRIWERLHSSYRDPKRTIFLLECEQENMYCEGLGYIGFMRSEVEYLKPFHGKICKLFKEILSSRIAKTKFNLPFAELGERLNEARIELAPEAQIQLAESAPVEKTPPTWTAHDSEATPEQANKTQTKVTLVEEENSVKTNSITTSKILENKDAFLGLYTNQQSIVWLKELILHGFEPNEVVEKWDTIKELLKSANDLGF